MCVESEISRLEELTVQLASAEDYTAEVIPLLLAERARVADWLSQTHVADVRLAKRIRSATDSGDRVLAQVRQWREVLQRDLSAIERDRRYAAELRAAVTAAGERHIDIEA